MSWFAITDGDLPEIPSGRDKPKLLVSNISPPGYATIYVLTSENVWVP